MKAVYTGMGNVDPICDECAAGWRTRTKFYDVPEQTCSFCWKNKKLASCIRCKVSGLYYGIWSIPRFRGTVGLDKNQWDRFLGMIRVALCKQCFTNGWQLLHSYAIGDQVILYRGAKEWHYPKFTKKQLLPPEKI